MAKKPAPQFFDFIIKRSLLVESAANGVGYDMFKVLEKSLQSVTEKLQGYKGDRTFTKTYFERAATELSVSLDNAKEQYKDILEESSEQMIQSEYDASVRRMKTVAGKEIQESPYTLPFQQIKTFLEQPMGGDTISGWIDRHLTGVKGKVRDEMGQAIVLNENVEQASKRLRNIEGIGRKGATMIARTVFNHTSNQTRIQSYKDNNSLFKKFRYVATLDSRTTFICASKDGEEAEKIQDLPHPPLHPNCRSTIIGLTSIDLALKDSDDPDLVSTRPAILESEKKTTKHRNGGTSSKWKPTKVKDMPAGTTFIDFFERQPESWQKAYLGKERFELWKNGNIQFSDLVKNNQRVSLEALKTKAQKEEVKEVIKEQIPEPAFGRKTKRKITAKELKKAGFYLDNDTDFDEFWNKNIGIDPQDFRKGLLKDIPKEYINKDLVIQMEMDGDEDGDSLYIDLYAKDLKKDLSSITIRREIFFGTKHVSHELFTIPEELQGSGISKKILNNWMDLYEELEIKQVLVHANISVGGYAWAKYGFNQEDYNWGFFVNRLNEKIALNENDLIKKYGENVLKKARNLLDKDKPNNLWKLSDTNIGKELLLHSDWHGKLDIDDKEAFERFKKYSGWVSKKAKE